MPIKQVFADMFGNHRFIFFKGIQITITQVCRDLKPDVQQLTEMQIIKLTGLIMPKGCRKGFSIPAIHLSNIRQFQGIDIDYRGVGLA